MGKPTYNFGKNSREKARQQKQMDKASRRMAAKQSKANIKADTQNEGFDTVGASQVTDIAKNAV
jgi:hypothetical protein